MKLSGCQELRLRHQIAPLIDVVFLLLIYFMVTATIIKPEGDIAFSLPLSERVPMDVAEGDRVLYAKYGGTEVKLDDKKYLILKESDVLAILD